MPEKQEAIVIANEEQASSLSELSSRLKDAGCEVTTELDFLNQIIIQCSEDQIPAVQKLKGVASVERSGSVQLPPPNSDVQ